jgi:hypothetical protein
MPHCFSSGLLNLPQTSGWPHPHLAALPSLHMWSFKVYVREWENHRSTQNSTNHKGLAQNERPSPYKASHTLSHALFSLNYHPSCCLLEHVMCIPTSGLGTLCITDMASSGSCLILSSCLSVLSVSAGRIVREPFRMTYLKQHAHTTSLFPYHVLLLLRVLIRNDKTWT